MKKIFLLLAFALVFSSCKTTPAPMPEIIYIKEPQKDPLPHPTMPLLDVSDSIITVEQTMEHVFLLNGAIQKLQILIEIYEREDRKLPEGYGNAKYQNMTLEQLKEEYIKLIGIAKKE